MSKICPVCERIYDDEQVFCASDGTALQGSGMGVDDLIGSVVDDRYVIESVLGAGGMGRVYLGHHVHLPRKVAIKVLQSKLTNDPAAIARFNREAASTSRIENLHVARVFDFGRMGSGATYLAMEYIPGRTLTELLDQEGALTPMRVVELIGQVAEGLGAAHRLDIVHRDLKPDNILIMEDDDGQECVKIVDFGIAKAIGPDDQGTLTAPGFVTGTPEYMSPEQFLGQTIDRRSDVFALGLLAFRALTNSQPFAKPTPERGFSAVLVDAPHRLDQVAPAQRWPKNLQAVFDRVLQRDPEARYPTAAAFADALREAFELPAVRMLGSRSTPAMGASAVDRHTRVLSGGHPGVAAAQATEHSTTPRSVRRWMAPAIGGGVLIAAALIVVALQSKKEPVASEGATNQKSALDSLTVPASVVSTATTPIDSTVQPVVSEPDRAPVSTSTPPKTPAVTPATKKTASVTSNSVPPRSNPAPATQIQAPITPIPAPVTQLPAPSTATTPDRSSRNVSAGLDAVRDSMDVLIGRDDAGGARGLIARVDGMLPRIPTPADSARALLLKANLLKLAGDRAAACRTLTQVSALNSPVDQKYVARYSAQWTCY